MRIFLIVLFYLSQFAIAKDNIVILESFDENKTDKNLYLPKKENLYKFPSCQIDEKTKESNKTKKYLFTIGEDFQIPLKYKESIEKIKTKFLKEGVENIWFDENSSFTKKILEIITEIKNSKNHALNPDLYHKKEIFSLIKQLLNKKYTSLYERDQIVRKLEILFTDSYIALMHDLYYGLSDWNEVVKLLKKEKEKFEWLREKKDFDFVTYAIDNLKKGDIKKSIEELSPPYKEYKNLQKALIFYRKIEKEGGFTKIPYGKLIRLTDRDKRIPLIRKRLNIDDKNVIDKNIYDKRLFLAIKDFQRRFGIFPSGKIGKRTIKALNMPVKKIISKIELNMERYKWLPKNITNSFIEVNIPSFIMKFHDNNKTILSMPVIVGKKERPTPVFTSYLSSIVLNPYWHVPKTIVQKDLLKKLQKNPQAFSQKNIHVYNSWKMKNEVDINEIDWYQFNEDDKIPFVFVQDPGKYNPLGKIKFQFSNPFAVFMHDTPNKILFRRKERFFSSGCIRLQKPLKLLEYIIKKEGGNFWKIKDIIESGKHDTIVLKNKIPIIIDYFTAKANEEGKVILYKDIYNYDKTQFLVFKHSNKQADIRYASNTTASHISISSQK